jgi:hypothetical protein
MSAQPGEVTDDGRRVAVDTRDVHQMNAGMVRLVSMTVNRSLPSTSIFLCSSLGSFDRLDQRTVFLDDIRPTNVEADR